MGSFFRQFLRGRVFGHPVHAMLVHFPSALFPVGLVFDLLALVLKESNLAVGAFYCMCAGLAGGVAAAVFGAIDYFRLPSAHPAWNKASLHALLNTVWLMLFAVMIGMRVKHHPLILLPTISQIIISGLGVAGLLFSNFLGGELVFRHRLGIIEEEKPGKKVGGF